MPVTFYSEYYRPMKRIITLIFVGIAGCILFLNQGYFYSESIARNIATAQFNRHCESMKIDPLTYSGPYKSEVGNAVWAFEWKARNPAKEDPLMIGVWLNSSGGSEIYIEPKGM